MELVGRYHGKAAARAAREAFIRQFSNKEVPDGIPEVRVESGSAVYLPALLKAQGLCSSTSEARRLIRQGALKINGHKVDREEFIFDQSESVIKLGKRRYLKVLMGVRS